MDLDQVNYLMFIIYLFIYCSGTMYKYINFTREEILCTTFSYKVLSIRSPWAGVHKIKTLSLQIQPRYLTSIINYTYSTQFIRI